MTTRLTDREFYYLVARESAPTIQSVAERTVRILSGERTAFLPVLMGLAGGIARGIGAVGGGTLRSLGPSALRTGVGPDLLPPTDPIQIQVNNLPDDQIDQLYTLVQSEIGGSPGMQSLTQPMAATVEDTEPANNFGFLKEPHDKLYPPAFQGGDTIPEEVRKKIMDHVLESLAQGGFENADEWITFTIYGSGVSYNWDEEGDFDVQMWIDAEKYNEGRDEPMTQDDLVAAVRRIIQIVNFPSFADLGLASEDSEGKMLIQYYGKPGTGSDEENLAQKPYACYRLDTDEWIVPPKPFGSTYYGDWFIRIEPKAKDIAVQAAAMMESLERNAVDWMFWSRLYDKHKTPAYKAQRDEARQLASMDKAGIDNLFISVFQDRMKAYSPDGKGIEDERDLLQKMLEVWGIFQRLKHVHKQPLPWEEQELPDEPEAESAEKENDSGDGEKKSKYIHVASVAPADVAAAVHDAFSGGGGTYNLDMTPATFLEGYYCSIAGYEQRIPLEEFNEKHFISYLDAIDPSPDSLIGTWVDHGYVFLDLTKHFEDRAEAIEFGVVNNQLAIWDIAAQTEIHLPTYTPDEWFTPEDEPEEETGQPVMAKTVLELATPSEWSGPRFQEGEYVTGAPGSKREGMKGYIYVGLDEDGYYLVQWYPMDSEPEYRREEELLPQGYGGPRRAKTSAWKDLMDKAQRLRQSGQVHILSNQPQHVVGRVEGDHGTYTTQFWREDPNSRAITMWDCECPWDQYAWQRTRQWKKYEGRPCSHVLALHWESQVNPPQPAEQMQLPGMGPQVPAPVPYGQQGPGIEPQIPRGPFPVTEQQPLQAPGIDPNAPVVPGLPPVPNPNRVDPRVLRETLPILDRLGLPQPTTPIPGASSQPQGPDDGGTIGFPGALSSWKLAAFQNGDIVRANVAMVGVDRDSRQWRIPRNAKGEVLMSDETTTIVIFPLSTGKLEPHLVKVETQTDLLTPAKGSPFIKRQR